MEVSPSLALERYRQRNITPSHLYRLGTSLFGDRDRVCRLRLLCTETQKEHDRELEPEVSIVGHPLPESRALIADDKYRPGSESDRYKVWLLERQQLRHDLDTLGPTRSWLHSKKRTPLEESQLQGPKSVLPCHVNFMTTMESEDAEREMSVNPSTMIGYHGHLADVYKKEEIRQFQDLISFCKNNGIHLDQSLAEKALLLPLDSPKKRCELNLPKPALQSQINYKEDRCINPPKKINTEKSKKDFGHQYIRSYRVPKKVKSKLDCWLTYEDYLKLTERIRHCPGFNYKNHGLPHHTAFWPGALRNKIHLMQIDSRSQTPNPQSIFYPAHSSDTTKANIQKCLWPENERGYVQFGSDRKQYHI